jgi:hypothetical protein
MIYQLTEQQKTMLRAWITLYQAALDGKEIQELLHGEWDNALLTFVPKSGPWNYRIKPEECGQPMTAEEFKEAIDLFG